MNRFCVINTENSKIWQPVTFGHMFEAVLKREGDQWNVCELASGATLPEDIMEYTGIVITGSHYNTRDRDTIDWYKSLADLIRAAAERGSPRVYGGCFGCQIIAQALGGEVDYNPGQQFALKAEHISLLPAYTAHLKGRAGCCDDDQCTCLNIIVSHAECVTKLPPHSELLAHSASCAHEIYITGPHKSIVACQSHPEFLDVKYAIHDRIAPVVIDERKRLVGEQVTESMDSFAKFTGEDSRLFMSNVSDFLHSSSEAVGRSRASTLMSLEADQEVGSRASTSGLSAAASRLNSLAATAAAALKTKPSLSRTNSLNLSVDGNVQAPALNTAAARQERMNDTANRLAALAGSIRRTPSMISPSPLSSSGHSASGRDSAEERRQRFAARGGAAASMPVLSSPGAAFSPRRQVSEQIKPSQAPPVAGAAAEPLPTIVEKPAVETTKTPRKMVTAVKAVETVSAPVASRQESSLPEETPSKPAATPSKLLVSEGGSFTPVVVNNVATSVEVTPVVTPAVVESKPVTAERSPETKKDAKVPPVSRNDASSASTTAAVPYSGVALFGLLFLGGLSFLMYRRFRR